MTTTTAPLPNSSPNHVAGDDRLVFTVTEAGELLGISRAFAYELVARGELPVIKLGRRRLVPKIALLALVRAGGSPLAAGSASATDSESNSDDHS